MLLRPGFEVSHPHGSCLVALRFQVIELYLYRILISKLREPRCPPARTRKRGRDGQLVIPGDNDLIRSCLGLISTLDNRVAFLPAFRCEELYVIKIDGVITDM